jgi:hypothetical protein
VNPLVNGIQDLLQLCIALHKHVVAGAHLDFDLLKLGDAVALEHIDMIH